MRLLAIHLYLVSMVGWSEGEEYLSNLKTLWPDPTGNSKGDIEVLIYGYDPFVVSFFTGSGVNERRFSNMYSGNPSSTATNSTVVNGFELNSVTFEFLGGISQPWSSITVQVYQQVGTNSILLGEFGNPSWNPTPTQWRGFSSFIDFHPLTNIVLQPSSEYFVSLSVPYNFPPDFGMLFAISSKYITPTDWKMGPTMTHVPVNFVEYLKFAVDATAIPVTSSTSSQGTNSTNFSVSHVKLSAKKNGSKIVLSWPSSPATAQLHSAPSFKSGSWSPVSAEPVIIKDQFEVTLPLSSSDSFFRLQAN